MLIQFRIKLYKNCTKQMAHTEMCSKPLQMIIDFSNYLWYLGVVGDGEVIINLLVFLHFSWKIYSCRIWI